MRRLLLAITLLGLCLVCSAASVAPTTGLRVAGSNTMRPLARLWDDGFLSVDPAVDVVVRGGGTSAGLKVLIDGRCDVVAASRQASPREMNLAMRRGLRLQSVQVARDGLAVMVSPENKLKSLTLAQLYSILRGNVVNWNKVGGSKRRIQMVGRDSSSGAYGFLQSTVLGGRPLSKAMLGMSTDLAVCQTVAGTPGAIGFASEAYARAYAGEHRLRIIPIAGKTGPAVTPTTQTIRNGRYPLGRFLYLYTTSKTHGKAARFIEFALSEKGQTLVNKAGFVPLPPKNVLH